MIKDRIKIHDQYQFELKLNYALPKKKKNTTYDIDAYFFLPKHIDINRNTYKRSSFYSDIHTYIRLQTPAVNLTNITKGLENPLQKVIGCINQLKTKITDSTIAHYEQQLKLFCCIVKSALREHLRSTKKSKDKTDLVNKLDQYIENSNDISNQFQNLNQLIETIPSSPQEVLDIYNFCNEYISILIESHTFKLMNQLKHFNTKDYILFKEKLTPIINNEIAKRSQLEYPSIPQENDDNEEFIYRSSILKKYVSNILFLDTRLKKEGKFIEQLLFGFAAGFAMIIATTIMFFYQYTYGNLTLQFFLAVIIGYIFKDRIKDMLKDYVSDHLKKHLFDHKINILTNNKIKIGTNKENFNFVKENKIDPDILKIRNKTHITNIENDNLGEKIIFYRKQINIFVKKYKKIYQNDNINGLTDIFRFNIRHFTNKMDNEKKSIYVLKDTDYKKIPATRMYHINLVLKYSSEDGTSYKRFRIILNRGGIKRIEKVKIS